jgi:hypothetical protein
MAVVFFYAPVGGILVGIISAVATFKIFARAAGSRAEGLRARRTALAIERSTRGPIGQTSL